MVVATPQDDPLWAILQNSARVVAHQFQSVKIEVLAPDAASPMSQRKLLQSLAGRKIDAICLYPLDAAAVLPEVNALASSGATVVTFGRDVPRSHRRLYAGPSEFDFGRTAAEAAALTLTSRAKTVLLLHAGQDHPTYSKRYFGFKHGLSQQPGLTLLREIDCHGNRVEAVHLVKLESRMYPRAGGWVFLDDWPFLDPRDRDHLVPPGSAAVLCACDPDYWDMLRDGRVQALIAYDVYRAFDEALLAAIRFTQTESRSLVSSSDVYIPVEIVTRKSLPAFEARWARWAQGRPTLDLGSPK